MQGQRSRYVRKSDNEKLTPGHIDQTVKHPQKKMFWGCFSYVGTGSLVPIEGMMNSLKYKELLEQKLATELKKVNPDGNVIFQQDSAPCHKSKLIMKYFKIKMKRSRAWIGRGIHRT